MWDAVYRCDASTDLGAQERGDYQCPTDRTALAVSVDDPETDGSSTAVGSFGM